MCVKFCETIRGFFCFMGKFSQAASSVSVLWDSVPCGML